MMVLVILLFRVAWIAFNHNDYDNDGESNELTNIDPLISILMMVLVLYMDVQIRQQRIIMILLIKMMVHV